MHLPPAGKRGAMDEIFWLSSLTAVFRRALPIEVSPCCGFDAFISSILYRSSRLKSIPLRKHVQGKPFPGARSDRNVGWARWRSRARKTKRERETPKHANVRLLERILGRKERDVEGKPSYEPVAPWWIAAGRPRINWDSLRAVVRFLFFFSSSSFTNIPSLSLLFYTS